MKILIRLSILIAVTLQLGVAQEVVASPPAVKSLQERWAWAMNESKQQKYNDGVWIAYSIDLLMRENSWIGSFRSIPREEDRTLYEIITGRHIDRPESWNSEGGLRNQARRALDRAEGKKERKMVLKEVALMFRYSAKPGDASSFREIHPTNVEAEVDLDGKPLIWLGKVPQDESVRFLKEYYKDMESSRQKRRVIVAIGIHRNNAAALDALESIVDSREPDNVRDDAAFWIGQQDTRDALNFLLKVARGDESRSVAEKAIFAISQIDLEEATDALIDLGRHAPLRDLRKKAVFWLGQRASRKAVENLKAFAYEGNDTEVQKQAVFALSQIHDKEAMNEIIKIARTHPNPRVRKQAIFWLGQSDDPRAFDVIVEIAKGK